MTMRIERSVCAEKINRETHRLGNTDCQGRGNKKESSVIQALIWDRQVKSEATRSDRKSERRAGIQGKS